MSYRVLLVKHPSTHPVLVNHSGVVKQDLPFSFLNPTLVLWRVIKLFIVLSSAMLIFSTFLSKTDFKVLIISLTSYLPIGN